MDEFLRKQFLDFEGLAKYDELIKAYIDNASDNGDQNLQELKDTLYGNDLNPEDEGYVKGDINDIRDALAVINGDAETEGSIKKAIADLVANAPEAFDTLKEIADWISNDEEGAVALVDRVFANEKAIDELQKESTDLKTYVDVQDKAVYDSIGSIEQAKIITLFKEAKQLNEGASIADALADLGEDEYLVLPAGATVAEDLEIEDAVYIDANGATFTGTITVDGTKDIVIENAVFANPVVVK